MLSSTALADDTCGYKFDVNTNFEGVIQASKNYDKKSFDYVKDTHDGRNIEIEEFKNKISFRDLKFCYGESKILDGITFTINKGESVALVGSSGSGKTTIAKTETKAMILLVH